ncbi:MAG: hypothetical protein AB7H90_04670 [Alphaproteobacteria bacterium]
MQVKTPDRILLNAQAKAEPAENVITRDYYASLPQIRLTAGIVANPMQPATAAEIILDGNDVARLVECALRHPQPNMRYGVLAAIWSHPDSFRQIFAFGLKAPEAFPEIRKIVAEELGKATRAPQDAGSEQAGPGAKPLLPQMPLPAHLRGRARS